MNPNTFEYDQPQTLSLIWFDKAGQQTTPPPGVTPSWSASDPTVATLTPSSDGQTCSEVGLKAGTEIVTMTAGSIVATTSLTLTPGIAVSAQIVVTPTVAPTTPSVSPSASPSVSPAVAPSVAQPSAQSPATTS